MSERPALPSILDLAVIGRGETAREALAGSVSIAQRAEERGFPRVWYAEHHNMSSIASSATSVVIAHVAANTERIIVGSGGIMLPNHAPLTIAEQFGTLAELHPGRIELGLGRAPGTDGATTRALRRDPRAADSFPDDVMELQGFLSGHSRVPGVEAVPGRGTEVPLWILGSSLYGAELAGVLGLPYAFASHFAPGALHEAMSLYRRSFRPSAQLDAPRSMAAANVVVADTDEAAEDQHRIVRRARVERFLAPDRDLTDDESERLLRSPQGRQVAAMMQHTAVGAAATARAWLDGFRADAGADDLIVVLAGPTLADRLYALDCLAEVYQAH